LGQGSLKNSYPNVYANSCMKDVKVGMAGLWCENLWEWNLSWRRNWLEWEKPIVQDFYQELESCKPKKDLDDIWLGDRNGSYTVKSTYDKIRNDMRGDDDKLFFKLWTAKALPSAQFFYWGVVRQVTNGWKLG